MNDISTAADAAPTEIVPGRIYALGGSVPADRPLSWFPPGWPGWLPFNCFVLRGGDALLLLETGVSVHRDAIGAGLEALGKGATRREVLMTRREPDNIINLPWLVHEFGIQRVYVGGDLNPLEFFDTIDEVNAAAQIEATSGVTTGFIRPGSILEIGDFVIEVLPTSLRILSTNWFYEKTTRTLFTSESFGFITSPAQIGPFVTRPAREDLSADRIARYFGTRIDWLRGIDTRPIIEEFRKVVDGRDVERICPCIGGVIEGREAVQHLFSETVRALTDLAQAPRRVSTDGFDYHKALKANVVVG